MSVQPLPGYSAYEMRHIETGIALYRTIATVEEILEANQNLKRRGNPNRFFEYGKFSAPSLHHTSDAGADR